MGRGGEGRVEERRGGDGREGEGRGEEGRERPAESSPQYPNAKVGAYDHNW